MFDRVEYDLNQGSEMKSEDFEGDSQALSNLWARELPSFCLDFAFEAGFG